MFRISMMATGVALTLTACGSSAGFDTVCVPNPLIGRDCTPNTVVDENGVKTVSTDLEGSTSFDVRSFELNDNEPIVLDAEGNPIPTVNTDFTNDTLTISGGDFDGGGTYNRNASKDVGDFRAFTADFEEQGVTYTALYGETPSGKMVVKIVGTGDYIPTGDFYAGFARDTSVALPVNGNSNFTGKYTGLMTMVNDGGMAQTAGDVSLEIEFQDNFRAKGSITNRTVVDGVAPVRVAAGSENPDGSVNFEQRYTELPDIKFAESSYSSTGRFEGVAQNRDSVGNVLETGTYSASMGGPDGSEVAGYFKVTSTALDARGSSVLFGGNIETHEVGVFTGLCVKGNPKLTCIRD